MAKRYIHSGGELEKKAYLERMGFKVEEKKKEFPKPKPCPHCNHLNPFTNNACNLCGMPLNIDEYKKVLESRRHPDDIKKIEDLGERIRRLEKVMNEVFDL